MKQRYIKSMHFPVIDGLRAIAVLSVIGFHSDHIYFPTGFIGVDIFFVISGFLITRILMSKPWTSAARFKLFFVKRIFRILPALFFVLITSLLLSYFILVPSQFSMASKSVAYILAFAANIFYLFNTDYFTADPESNLFLHTWSLSLEEQFYIMFPILCLLFRKLSVQLLHGVSAIALISFILMLLPLRDYENVKFYLIVSRFWEFMCGSLAYIIFTHRRQIPYFARHIGVIFLLLAFIVASKDKLWPNYSTVLPVLGTAFILVDQRSNSILDRLLGSKYARHIGKLSYSMYLWHWPIFILWPETNLHPLLDCITQLMGIYVSSLLTFVFIESPFRTRNQRKFKAHAKLKLLFFCSIVLLFLSLPGNFTSVFLLTTNVPESFLKSMERTSREAECFNKGDYGSAMRWYCIIGDSDHTANNIVFGDSHALHYLDTLDDYFKEHGMSAYFISAPGCLPFLGTYSLRFKGRKDQCRNLNDRVANLAAEVEIRNLILAGRWNYYTGTGPIKTDVSFIGRSEDAPMTLENSQLAFSDGVANTVRQYDQLGVNLILLGQVPQQLGLPIDLYIRQKTNNWSIHEVSVTLKEHEQAVIFQKDVFQRNSIKVFDPANALCSSRHCPYGDGELSYYNDNDHLSIIGAAIIKSNLFDFLEESIK